MHKRRQYGSHASDATDAGKASQPSARKASQDIKDDAATVELARATSTASQLSACNRREDGADGIGVAPSFSDDTPSSTQAVFKTGSTAMTGKGNRGLQSVSRPPQSISKQADVKAAGQDAKTEGQIGKSPTEPVRMLAVKDEFERRLQKKVSVEVLCSLNLIML